MTKEDKIILKLPDLFRGLNKIEMLDILLKTEQIINSIDKFTSNEVLTALNSSEYPKAIQHRDGSFYLYIDGASGIRIYKKDKYKFFFNPTPLYYYMTLHDISPKRLTSENLLQSTIGTNLHTKIMEYLFNNKLTKRNRKTNRLFILEYLE